MTENNNAEVLAASLTPLNDDSSIDTVRFAEHVRWLLENGCDGVLLFGTTGEANSFSMAERTTALEYLLIEGIPPDKLMVGTGCCALPDTLALTHHALANGVCRALVLPPFYYKNVSEQGLFDTFSALIDCLGNAALRVYLYHFPKMAVVSFTPELIARLVERYPEQVAGIKDSTGDRDHTEMLNNRFPSLKVYAGSEAFLLDYYRNGGIGCISATTNLTARLAAAVRDNRASADAYHYQAQLSAVRAVLERYPLTAALKALLARHTGQDSWTNVRLPLTSLPDGSAAALNAELATLSYEVDYPV